MTTKPFDYTVTNPDTGATKTFAYTVVNPGLSVTKPFNYTVTTQGPSVALGPNRTVEAGDVFTLAPQTEQAGSAAITSRLWKQGATTIGTTASVLVGAPITRTGTSVTYTYTATDANGATSSPATILVTVMPAPLRGPGGVPLIERAP